MAERYLEIKFYFFILNLIAKFNYDINVLGIIEALCYLGNVDVVLIKRLIKQIRERDTMFTPINAEVMFVCKTLKVPVRYIKKHYGMSQYKQESNYKYAIEHPQIYNTASIHKVLKDEEFEELKKFMITLDRIQKL